MLEDDKREVHSCVYQAESGRFEGIWLDLPAAAGSTMTPYRKAMHGEIIHELIAAADGHVP